MATPRKHWFRVADSILHENWPHELVATMVKLCAYLNTRWARDGLDAEQACSADIPLPALMQITGKRRSDIARKSLGSLAEVTGMSVEHHAHSTQIVWPKYAEFQGLSTPKPPPPQTPPQDAPAPAGKHKSKRRSPRPKARPFPADGLSDAELEQLRSWAAGKEIPWPEVLAKIEAIRLWAEGNGKTKVSWVATIQGAVNRDREERASATNRQRPAGGGGRSQTPIEDAFRAAASRRGLRPVG